MEPSNNALELIVQKLRTHDASEIAIRTFTNSFNKLAGGDTGIIPESDIEALEDAPDLETLENFDEAGNIALSNTAVIKLNGGLGTSMGLYKAKSLLPAKDGLSFLDIICKQVLKAREVNSAKIPLVLMNSFRTERDTLDALKRHPQVSEGQGHIPLSFVQNQVPKLLTDSLEPVRWPDYPELEWCPPGHGDIYCALSQSGLLDLLLDGGIRYAFVSNADNLGAVLDTKILGYLASKEIPFLMEVADRTEMDKKGGHIAMSKQGGLVLRERAQCAENELDAFEDINKYRYFNTNSLWINLEALNGILKANKGVLDLPLIRNQKTVDPTKPDSPAVYQLETAMGAAIASFDGAQALRVPRTRFAPIKTTDDLLELWSSNYALDKAYRVLRKEERQGKPVVIKLDPRFYRNLKEFSMRFESGAPDLSKCSRLTVEGDIFFEGDIVIEGDITLNNKSGEIVVIPAGTTIKESQEW